MSQSRVRERQESSSQSLRSTPYRLISLLEVRNAHNGVYPEKELEKLNQEEPNQSSFGKNSTLIAVSHLFRSLFSPTILVMPAAFKNGGLIFAIFGHIFLVVIIGYNMGRIVLCAEYLSNREKLVIQTYDQVAFVSFDKCSARTRSYAKQVRNLINIMVIITNMDALTIFIIFIARNMHDIISFYLPNVEFQVRHYIFFQMVPVMLINTIRQLKYLSPFSIISSILLLVSCTCIFQFYFVEAIPTSWDRRFIGDYTIIRFLAMVLFSQSGISISLTIKSSMKNPYHFLNIPGVYCSAIVLATCIYVPFGFFGYLRFGENVFPSIMLNIPPSELKGIFIKTMTMLSVLLAIPIGFYVAFNVLWNNFVKYRVAQINHIACEYFFRAILVFILYVLATTIPTLGPMIVLKGALLHSQLELIYPPIVEYVTFYPEKGNGKAYCRLIKAIVISSFGILCCIGGTVVGIWDFVSGSQELLQ